MLSTAASSSKQHAALAMMEPLVVLPLDVTLPASGCRLETAVQELFVGQEMPSSGREAVRAW